MARRKQTDSKPPKRRSNRHRESPTPPPTPDIGEKFWRLRHATSEVWACLDNVTTVADLKAFWLARRVDVSKRVIQVEFPTFVERTWIIMRQLSDEMGPDIPTEPSIGHAGTFLQAYYDDERIPVDKARLRNTIDQIVAWCRQVELRCSAKGHEVSSDNEPSGDGPVAPDTFRFRNDLFGGLAPRLRKALEACWKKRTRTASCDDLAETVWGDREDSVSASPAAMATLRRDLNRFFRQHKISYHARVKHWHLCIEGGPPRQTKAGNKR